MKYLGGFVAVVLNVLCMYMLFKWFVTTITGIHLSCVQVIGLQLLIRTLVFHKSVMKWINELPSTDLSEQICYPLCILFIGWMLYCIHMQAFTF